MKDEITKYKCVVFPGNNPKVIQEALLKRNVWSCLPQDKALTCNFIWKPLNFSPSFYQDIDQLLSMHRHKNIFVNHFENNSLIGTKSGLLRSLKYYYSHEAYDRNINVFEVIPTTFIVHSNKDSVEFKAFYERYRELEKKKFTKEKVPQKHCEHNVWFIKPESQNQGRGITLTNSLKDMENFIFSKSTNSAIIIQKAIEKPLLYKGRKFDIRVWVLVSQNFDIYYYNEPYIRTSSNDYEATNFKTQIHLTNNAQQKKTEEYSKFEKGNTISFGDLEHYLRSLSEYTEKASQIIEMIHQRMKAIVLDVFFSVKKLFLRSNFKKEFELFGFDFILDEDFRVWLLEVNANPYLGTPNEFIKNLMPKMIDEMLEIVLDPYFQPENYLKVQENKFELLFKETGVSRISQARSGSTEPSRKKNFYPLQSNEKSICTKRNRRNSEAISIGQNTDDLRSKIRIQTPIESIKYLLESYCYSDLEPFINPTKMFLNSLRNLEGQGLSSGIKNLKLVVETRIANVFLERKISDTVKPLLLSPDADLSIKVLLLNGIGSAGKNSKCRQSIINIYFCTLQQMAKEKQKEKEPLSSSNQLQVRNSLPQPIAQALLKLMIKLGGYVDRTVFVPGETRENENYRDFFIRSSAMQFMLNLHEYYPNLASEEIAAFLKTLSEKDWKVYQSCKADQSNTILIEDSFMTESDLMTKMNSTKMTSFASMYDSVYDSKRDRKRKTSFREANEFKNVQAFNRDSKKVSFPKIEKKSSFTMPFK